MDEKNGPFEEDIDVDDPTIEHSSTRTQNSQTPNWKKFVKSIYLGTMWKCHQKHAFTEN